MVRGDPWFRRYGNRAFDDTGICSDTTTYGFLLSQEWYGGIPGFAGMVRGDPRFRRIGNRAFDDTGIYGGTTTYGFLLSQEWYGGIPGFAGMVRGDPRFRRIGNTAFNETGICGGTTTYGFLLSQEYLCLKSSIFLCDCLMVFYPGCAALCHGIQLQYQLAHHRGQCHFARLPALS